MRRLTTLIFVLAGLLVVIFSLPAGAENGPRVFLSLVGRGVSPASWPTVPSPTPGPTLRPSPTPAPSATPTLAPTDVRIVSASAFTKTLGAETFLFIVGEVGNAGPDTAVRDVTVRAALLDADGELIRHAVEPAYQSILGPGELTPFRIVESLPADYADHALYLEYDLTSDLPPSVVTPSATSTYVDGDSGWQYFVGEVVNTTEVNMAKVRAVVTLYDEAGSVVNVVDSGTGANSLYEDVIGVGQTRPFRVVLRHGPTNYASLRWQVVYQATDALAPTQLPIHVGHVARNSGTLRDDNGRLLGYTHWLDIFGEVQNTTGQAINAVRVYAAFYSGAGQVMNTGVVQGFHGRLGPLAPGKLTPFHLVVSSGPIPDVETPRRLHVAYEPAEVAPPDQITVVTQRAYRETGSVMGVPVEWLGTVGQVRNDSAGNVQNVRAVATFYDEAGRVVNAMAGRVFQPTLFPGAASPFKIRTASGAFEYDHYTLDVVARRLRTARLPSLSLDLQPPDPGAIPAVFQGQVRNDSGEPATGVTVFVALYDADGQILVAEGQLVAEEVPAGGAVPFTLRVEQGTDGWREYDAGVVSR